MRFRIVVKHPTVILLYWYSLCMERAFECAFLRCKSRVSALKSRCTATLGGSGSVDVDFVPFKGHHALGEPDLTLQRRQCVVVMWVDAAAVVIGAEHGRTNSMIPVGRFYYFLFKIYK